MKKNTKKKLFTLMLVIMLLAITVVGGTLAWFTAEQQVTNTFTVGSVKIQQNEWDQFGSPFQQNQELMPVVNMDNPSADENYVHKVVTISNTGKNPAYVRTFIAVDARIADYLYLDLNVADGWKRDADRSATINGKEYKVLVFTYENALAANLTTPTLLKGVYLGAQVDVQEKAEGVYEFCHKDADGEFQFSGYAVTETVQVLVATQAVQSEGFSDATTALDSAFGTELPSFVPVE